MRKSCAELRVISRGKEFGRHMLQEQRQKFSMMASACLAMSNGITGHIYRSQTHKSLLSASG